MLDRVKVRERLWNPPNGRVSEEIEIVSEPELRRRRIEALMAEEAAALDKSTNDRWGAIIERLKTAADQQAADIAQQETQDRDRGVVTMEMIVRVVCGLYHLKRMDLMSDRRTASVVYPRQVGMYLCRQHTTFSTLRIGAKFGGRDHTTVLHAINKITALIGINDTKIITDLQRIRMVLGVE